MLEGLRVTTPLRTACDLGRLLHRDQALAALDSLAALDAFTLAELSLATLRFPRYRGVRQLRVLVPLVDARAQSPGESILRLRWLDAGLPRPECQVAVPAPSVVGTTSTSVCQRGGSRPSTTGRPSTAPTKATTMRSVVRGCEKNMDGRSSYSAVTTCTDTARMRSVCSGTHGTSTRNER